MHGRSTTHRPCVRHGCVPYNATQRNTTQHNATQRNATTQRNNATQRNTTQHNATQRNTTQHNATQRNTTIYNKSFYQPALPCSISKERSERSSLDLARLINDRQPKRKRPLECHSHMSRLPPLRLAVPLIMIGRLCPTVMILELLNQLQTRFNSTRSWK
jgi:hypothetical protein